MPAEGPQACNPTGAASRAADATIRVVNRYAVVIHEDPEGGFWAEVPALPGCYSQGESVEELLVNVREAIAGVLEVMAEEGGKPEENIQILDVAV